MKTRLQLFLAAAVIATGAASAEPIWVNQDQAGSFDLDTLSRGVPASVSVYVGTSYDTGRAWFNQDQAGGYDLDTLSRGVPVTMNSYIGTGYGEGRTWFNQDEAGGFSFDDFAHGRIGR